MAYYSGILQPNQVANFSFAEKYIHFIETPSKTEFKIYNSTNNLIYDEIGNLSGFKWEIDKEQGTLLATLKNAGTKAESFEIFAHEYIQLDIPAKVDNFVTINAGASIGIDPAENTVKLDQNNNTIKIDPSNNIAKNDELPKLAYNPGFWFNVDFGITDNYILNLYPIASSSNWFDEADFPFKRIESRYAIGNIKQYEDTTGALFTIGIYPTGPIENFEDNYILPYNEKYLYNKSNVFLKKVNGLQHEDKTSNDNYIFRNATNISVLNIVLASHNINRLTEQSLLINTSTKTYNPMIFKAIFVK